MITTPTWLPVCNESLLREHGVYLKPPTLRKYWQSGLYKPLFRKIRHRLYFDASGWAAMLDGKRDADGYPLVPMFPDKPRIPTPASVARSRIPMPSGG